MESEPKKLNPEQPITPEYSYEQGLSMCIDLIIERLNNQPYFVVAFCASGTDVGKTTLARDIRAKLHEQGIIAISAHMLEELRDELRYEPELKPKVFILDQMEWGAQNIKHIQAIKENHDQKVETMFKQIKYNDIKGINLWIGICTPDQPFGTEMISGDPARPIADIIIKNTEAKRKRLN